MYGMYRHYIEFNKRRNAYLSSHRLSVSMSARPKYQFCLAASQIVVKEVITLLGAYKLYTTPNTSYPIHIFDFDCDGVCFTGFY